MPLDWQAFDEKEACGIYVEKQSDFDDHVAPENQFDWIMDKMSQIKKAFEAISLARFQICTPL